MARYGYWVKWGAQPILALGAYEAHLEMGKRFYFGPWHD
jgi:hypothetical protein